MKTTGLLAALFLLAGLHAPASPAHAGTAVRLAAADPRCTDQLGALFRRLYHCPPLNANKPVVPPPPPPPPPAVTTYIVFFDFNETNLTPGAVGVVRQAVKTAKAQGIAKITVIGHTDTAEPDGATLSLRRAEAVKTLMVQSGLSGASIATSGRGATDLLVPTGPGTRLPKNRRAAIDLGG
jgi:OmpA-OmpF porin, OOP family